MPLDTAIAPPPLARTSVGVEPPPIPACRAWGLRYDGRHGPAIDLTQAVPGWGPPPALLAKLAEAGGDARLAGYGPLEGEAALREAVAAELGRVYGGDAAADDLRITAGSNLGFSLAMSAIAAPGDSVLLPAPWFFNHPMALRLRGVRPIPLPTTAERGFLPDLDAAERLLDATTRAIVLVTPNNPTGAVLPPALIDGFAALCRRRGLWLVLDETYRDFRGADAGAPHGVLARHDWREFVVQLYSFSKAYCIPGHRMGAVTAGPALRAELLKAVDNVQICPPRPPQAALAWAVPALRDWRAENATKMGRRAEAVRAVLAAAPGWRLDAIGAYFAWLRVPDAAPDAAAVAERLATERGLITLPGSAFGPGGERHLRLAFADSPPADLAAVPERLADLV